MRLYSLQRYSMQLLQTFAYVVLILTKKTQYLFTKTTLYLNLTGAFQLFFVVRPFPIIQIFVTVAKTQL